MTTPDDQLLCWRCGENLAGVPVPFGRAAYCPSCRADLHVCRMCVEYDKKLADKCRAELDDIPFEKERANFCDHFSPSPTAYQPEDSSEADRARAELNALFGVTDDGISRQPGESKSDAARRELESLFDTPKKDTE